LLSLGMIGVSAAQAGKAPDWKVGAMGNWLFNEIVPVRSLTASSTEITRLNVPGLGKGGTVIESANTACTQTGEIVGAPLETPGTKQKVAMSCTKTTVAKPGGCTVQSVGAAVGTITYNTMKSTLVWLNNAGESAGDLLSAEKAGGSLTELEVKGAGCEIAGKYTVSGEIITPFTPVAMLTQAATQGFPEPSTGEWWNNNAPRERKGLMVQLTVGGKNATLQSSFKVTLNPVDWFGIFAG
jgi:hypothetical protein